MELLKLKRSVCLTSLNGDRLISDDWRILPLAKVVSAFLAEAEKGHPLTAKEKRRDLNYFLAYLGRDRSVMSLFLGDVTKDSIAGFLHYRLEMGEAPATLARRFDHLRSFDNWLRDILPYYPRPSLGVTRPKVVKRAFEGINGDAADKLIEAAYQLSEREEVRIRAGFCVAMLRFTALRRNEIRLLTLSQLSKRDRWFENVKCKGNVFRRVYIEKGLTPHLDLWLPIRARLLYQFNIKDHERYPLIVSTAGARVGEPDTFRISAEQIYKNVVAASRAIGIERCHPHKLRHGYAHELLDNTKDIRLVAQALGHSDLKTTMRYTERTDDQFAAAIESARRVNE